MLGQLCGHGGEHERFLQVVMINHPPQSRRLPSRVLSDLGGAGGVTHILLQPATVPLNPLRSSKLSATLTGGSHCTRRTSEEHIPCPDTSIQEHATSTRPTHPRPHPPVPELQLCQAGLGGEAGLVPRDAKISPPTEARRHLRNSNIPAEENTSSPQMEKQPQPARQGCPKQSRRRLQRCKVRGRGGLNGAVKGAWGGSDKQNQGDKHGGRT